jgi:hypothetical protein
LSHHHRPENVEVALILHREGGLQQEDDLFVHAAAVVIGAVVEKLVEIFFQGNRETLHKAPFWFMTHWQI